MGRGLVLDEGADGAERCRDHYADAVALEVGAPLGARLVDDKLYVAGAKSFSIYDVSDPTSPVELGTYRPGRGGES